MDGNKSRHALENTCQCRCPCHYRNNDINESQPSNHVIAKVSKAPSRSATAQITFSETIQIPNETDSDTSMPYNPFHVKAATPAAAAFSKSFLHVKNMVKNMTARWESLADSEEDDNSGKPRRYSLTARCVGPAAACANPENLELDWKRVSVDKGDTKEYHWKLKNQMPENIEHHEYSLVPLQSSKNVSTFNKDASSSTASNHQTFQTQTPTLQAAENSFQEDNSRNVDTVSKKSSLNNIANAKESSNQTAIPIRSIPIPPHSENTRPFHSTNPFNPTDTEEQRFPQKKNESSEIFFKNEFNMQAPAIAIPPQSVQSEVKNVRKSFEQEVDGIVEKVNRTTIDSHDHRHHPTDTDNSTTKMGPSWAHEIPFPDQLKVSQSKVDDIITKSEQAKENESKTNIGSASTPKSKEVRENNIGNDSRADIYSFPVAHAEPAQSQMIGVGPEHSSYDKKDGNDDLDKSDVKAVKTTLSLDPDNASLRRKSLDDYLPVPAADKSGTGSRPNREDSKLTSSSTYITTQSQLAKNYLRNMEHGGVTKNDTAGVNRSIQSVVQQITNDASIQTSQSICGCDELHSNATTTSSLDPTKSKAVLGRAQSKVRVSNEFKSKSKLDLGYTKENATENTLAKMGKKTNASNEAKKPIPSIMVVQEKENESVDETNSKDDRTPLEMMARIATANDEQDFATYMAWISVQGGCASSLGAKNEKYQESHYCQPDQNANVNMMYNETPEETSPDSEEQEDEGKEQFLNTLSKEYDDVVATPSQLLVETIGQSVSVSNTSIEMQNRCSGDRIHRDHLKECHSSSQMIGSTKSQSSSDMDKGSSTSSGTKIRRSKREFYKCHKCHKIVASGEAAFYSNEEVDIAWHPRCFTCIACDKDLSQSDHSFFDEEPYCPEHYVRVANIPKCSKCQQLIYDPTYTSAAGNSWHQQHFSCQACKKPLVDAKYVFVRNKHPYCFHCHEKHFPKICNTCDGPIPASMPFVQGGNAFWHSSTKCMHCSSCNGSLVGRTLFFRRGKNLYCNRYCALREM